MNRDSKLLKRLHAQDATIYILKAQNDALFNALSADEETVCHCNLRENAELIAEILDADADWRVFGT